MVMILNVGDKPGYYRISGIGWTYCNMTEIAITAGNFLPTCAGVGGGWRRIADINITDGDACPNGWVQGNHSGVSFCRKVDAAQTCSSTNLSTNGISYQRVCGRARGYQKGLTTGFADPGSFHYQGIDGWYGDTLALVTYNSPRQHVWSYVAGIQDNQRHGSNCPCADGGGRAPPTFVGANYYCESGAAIGMDRTGFDVFYFNDPLWDGAGCIIAVTTPPSHGLSHNSVHLPLVI